MGTNDIRSILLNGWDDDNEEKTDLDSVSTQGWAESPTTSEDEEDFRNFSVMPNTFFQKENNDYDSESELFDSLITEAFNMYGNPMLYYVNSYDTRYDKLYGEDNDRTTKRFFNVQVYYELPEEQELWTFQGIEGIDNFKMFVSFKHFSVASTFDPHGNPNAYDPYIPQVGDYIKSKYNDIFYEILAVKKQSNQIHKRVHIWDFSVKPMRNEHLTTSADISYEPVLDHAQAMLDIFDIDGVVEAEKPIQLYEPKNDELSQDPTFGDW